MDVNGQQVTVFKCAICDQIFPSVPLLEVRFSRENCLGKGGWGDSHGFKVIVLCKLSHEDCTASVITLQVEPARQDKNHCDAAVDILENCILLFCTTSIQKIPVVLQEHERTHIGVGQEKSFFCEICGKSFTSAQSRTFHHLIHEGEIDGPRQIIEMSSAVFLSDNGTKLTHFEKWTVFPSFHPSLLHQERDHLAAQSVTKASSPRTS